MQMREPTQAAEWTLHDYLDMAVRRKTIILIVFIIVLCIGVLYTMTRPAIYGAATAFIIEENENSLLNMQSRYGWYPQEGKPLEYFQEIIYSPIYRQLVSKAVQHDSTLRSLPLEMDAFRNAKIALGSLMLSRDENSSIMTLSVHSSYPVIAFRAADLAAQAFRLRNQQIDMEGAKNTEEFIAKQRSEAQIQLESTERALQEFQAGKQIRYSPMDQNLLSQVEMVEATLTDIETQRQLAETNLATYQEQLKNDYQTEAVPEWSLDLPEVKEKQNAIEKLEEEKNSLSRDAEKNKAGLTQVNQKIAEQKNQLRQIIYDKLKRPFDDNKEPQVLRATLETRMIEERISLNSLKNKEAYYRRLLEEYRRDSPQLLEKALQLASMQRTQMVYQHLLTYLVQRYEEAKITASVGSGGIRIVNPAAMPTQPLPRSRMRNIMVTVIMGLGLAFGLVLLVEYLDPAVRSKAEIERRTGLTVVGQIPFYVNKSGEQTIFETFDTLAHMSNLKSKKRGNLSGIHSMLYPLLNRISEPGIFAESFRNLRTDLHYFRIDHPVRKLLISSSVSGEGKSLITANLGLAFAELGKRVLIIDCDLRKPKQHTVFNVQREPGLTDVLSTGDDWHTALMPVQSPDLFLMPCGAIPPNPTEILNSRKMAELIGAAEKEFDYILVDSPPLLALSDARVLSRLIQDILLIYRYADTNIRLTLESIDSLKNSHSSIVGLVLNGLNPHNESYHYKYHYFPE